ncbi:MAG: hypothetical protein PHS96_02050 [Anaerolineales bacterium]|nr:hypothetical protein [Anaerolineales bacterium]
MTASRRTGFERVINSRLGIGLALSLAKTMPPSLGYPVAEFLADRISGRKSMPMVQGARANQWVVTGEALSGAELDYAVRAVYRNNARYIYDFYHHLGNLQNMMVHIEYNATAEEMIHRSRTRPGETGLVIAGLHLSNFDLVLQAAGMHGLTALVLSAPRPGGAYRLQNRLRRGSGLEILPTSQAALRRAIHHLRAGGSVLTGMDFPAPGGKLRPRFFGRPSTLPLHYVYLAVNTGAPVYIFAAIQEQDGRYHVHAHEPMLMEPAQDADTALLTNAERALQVAESYIRMAPQQWSMFHPVWPEALEMAP